MQKLIDQIRAWLSAGADHRGDAVQSIKIGKGGEVHVELVDKVRAAELLSKLLDTSALYRSEAASGSRPCEGEEERDHLARVCRNYLKRYENGTNEPETCTHTDEPQLCEAESAGAAQRHAAARLPSAAGRDSDE